MRRSQGGFTVVELLVTGTILLVLMMFVSTILFPSAREIRRAEADVATQQSVLLAIEKLFQEAGYSDGRSAVVADSPVPSVSFLSREPAGDTAVSLGEADYTPLGARSDPLEWKKFVLIYYWSDDERVCRKEFPYDGGTELAALKADRLASLIADDRYPERVVAFGVSAFGVRMTGPSLLKVNVSASQPGGADQEETRLSTKIAMRNSL
ncbi:MAG: type II secretion system protein [Armatimonadetes bacterium]|nr:type II secretion system protein [Armatimonadota bacterium]